MTAKQGAVIGGIAIACGLSNALVVILGHVGHVIPVSLIILISMATGTAIGILEQRWLRNRERADFIASRLLGSPQPHESSNTQYDASNWYQQLGNANSGSQLAGMGQTNRRLLESIFSSGALASNDPDRHSTVDDELFGPRG
jgi:hypothetical protein